MATVCGREGSSCFDTTLAPMHRVESIKTCFSGSSTHQIPLESIAMKTVRSNPASLQPNHTNALVGEWNQIPAVMFVLVVFPKQWFLF